jgi:hypothetical protein
VFKEFRNKCAVLSATSALLAVAALPATTASAASSCAAPHFDAPFNIYLGREGETRVWSTDVTLYAWCNDTSDHPALSNVQVVGVGATVSQNVGPLLGSANGDVPDVLLPVNGSPYPANLTTISAANPQGLLTDSTGHVTFHLRVESTDPTVWDLALPDGGPQLVGLYLSYGYSNGPVDPGQLNPLFPNAMGGGAVWAATPELDSLVLFGSGAAGMAAYALVRIRARRRD